MTMDIHSTTTILADSTYPEQDYHIGVTTRKWKERNEGGGERKEKYQRQPGSCLTSTAARRNPGRTLGLQSCNRS